MKTKTFNYFSIAMIMIALLANHVIAQPVVITQWNFDNETLEPNIGSGTATNIGGTTFTWATGNSPAPNRAWNTTTYPLQGTNPGTAGVQFMLSTLGYEDIALDYYHRASGTASRWAQIEYTLDGGNTWIAHDNNNGGISPHDTFYEFSFDLSSVTGANNNANFGIRIVSIFSPFAFDQNETLTYGPNEAYQRANAQSGPPGTGTGTGDYGQAGTWRFDDVTISGVEISTSAPVQLAITSINGGAAVQVNVPFYFTVQTIDVNGVPSNVNQNTQITISKQSGTGTFGGVLSATIPAGSNAATLHDITYNVAESGVSVTASVTSGMSLSPSTSAVFQVLSEADHMEFNNFPENGTINQTITAFTVQALRNDNSIDEYFNGLITLAKASGPGEVYGTLSKFAVNGIATFNDIIFNVAGDYTLSASSSGLTTAESEIISIESLPEGLICHWDFNNETLDPIVGTGTAANVGGTTTAWAAGVPGNPDRGWNTTNYPEQATDSKTAGVEFLTSTSGFQNIQISYFHRHSGTASRHVVLQYTVDGVNWTDFETYANMPYDTFIEHNFDLSSIDGANNNPDFGIRVLSMFSPEPFTDPQSPNTQWEADTAYQGTREDRNYTISGTWRFDEVMFMGDPFGLLMGDANCDGIVNIIDVITATNYLLGQTPQPFCFENADINGDGIIDILDCVGIVNLLLSK
ncbi:MAG TPA: dockerin type I repeat-containing protein [Bacteroidales bacterium]|nr:dockerin type I repeat-containing protein [Bacteroidales bacterium]